MLTVIFRLENIPLLAKEVLNVAVMSSAVSLY